MSNTRIVLTLDTFANMTGVGAFNSIKLENLELCYEQIMFSSEVESAIASQADADGNLQLKTQSYSVSSQMCKRQSQGQNVFIYNTRLSSIKSLLLSAQGSGDQVNHKFDSVDITAGNGTIQFQVGSNTIPELPLSTLRNHGRIYQELSDTWGGVAHDMYGARMSILAPEFLSSENVATTKHQMAKAYYGVSVEKLNSGALLSGISSQQAPINVILNLNTQTQRDHALSLITLHDAILTVNVGTRMCSLKV